MESSPEEICREIDSELSQLLNCKLKKLQEAGINYMAIRNHSQGNVFFCANNQLANVFTTIAKELFPAPKLDENEADTIAYRQMRHCSL